MDKAQFRMDPLTGEWTIFNPSRAVPPFFHKSDSELRAPSPFLAGFEQYAPNSLHESWKDAGWQVRVVPSRVPILRVEGDPARLGDHLDTRMDAVGAHEIVVEDPGTRSFENLPVNDAARVIHVWKIRIEDLMRDTRMVTFGVVKASGEAAGQTVAHSVSQVFAMAILAPSLKTRLESACAYFLKEKKSLFHAIIEREQRESARVVYENHLFLAFCPHASRTPFEIAIWPKYHQADFHHISADAALQFADALLATWRKLNHALDHAPAQFTLTTAPSRSAAAGDWPVLDEAFRWHAMISPVLNPRTPLENTSGCHLNTVAPEAAAEFLRQQESGS